MDKSILILRAARGAVVLGAFFALIFNFSNLSHASSVSEKDLPGAYHQNTYDPVTGQMNGTPSAESLHGEAVVAHGASPASLAKQDFADGGKGIGRGFKNGVKATGRGFKKAGTTMATSFKKAGGGIKWFFTGQWFRKKDQGQVEERDLMAERNSDTYYQQPYPQNQGSGYAPDAPVNDDLELDFEEGSKPGNDWVKQDSVFQEKAS